MKLNLGKATLKMRHPGLRNVHENLKKIYKTAQNHIEENNPEWDYLYEASASALDLFAGWCDQKQNLIFLDAMWEKITMRGLQIVTLEEHLRWIRDRGWKIAIHNDYTVDNIKYTSYVFIKDSQTVIGEGESDILALIPVEEKILEIEKNEEAES